MTIGEMKAFEDKKVIVRRKDGEVATVLVRFVDFEYEDIIVEMIETNQPHLYKDPAACFTIPAAEIDSVSEILC